MIPDHALAIAERAGYEAEGFLLRESALPESEVNAIASALERACQRVVPASRDAELKMIGSGRGYGQVPKLGIKALGLEGPNLDVPRLIEPVTQLDETLQALWRHPGLVELAQIALDREDVGPFTSKFNAKRAQSGGEFFWHQDYPYWYSTIRRDSFATCTIAVCVDAMTAENGALEVIPGTQQGPLPRKAGAEGMERYLTAEEAVEGRPGVLLLAPRGSLVLFSPFLVHRSGPNRSTGDRRALFLTFQPAGKPEIDRFDILGTQEEGKWLDELP